MSEKNTMTTTERNAETKINRLMLFFAAAAVAVIALLLVNKNVSLYYRTAFVVLYILPWVKIASVVLLAAAAVWYFIDRKNHASDEDRPVRIFSPAVCLGLAVLLVLIAFTYEYFLIPGAVILICAALVLSFIESSYPRDFFLYAVYTCLLAVLLYLCGRSMTASALRNVIKIAGRVLAIVIPLAVSAVLLLAKKNNGKIGRCRLIGHNGHVYPFLIASAVALIGAVLTLILSGAALYAILALFAAFLVIAIVYTVRMM